MPLEAIAFYAFAGLIVVSALLVVTRRNPITAAIFLIAALLGVAGIFLTVHAEFLFAVQILVYTGGVMVLFLFAIMLVNVEVAHRIRGAVKGWYWPVAFCLFLVAAFGYVLLHADSVAGTAKGTALPDSNIEAVGRLLLVDYLLPFEVLSVLLLVAMVGAILLNRKEV